MKRRKKENKKAKQRYVIDRSKFMTRDQVNHLLQTCTEYAQLDQLLGKRVWISRNMLVSVFLRTGLRCNEAGSLKVGDIHITDKESYLTTCGKGHRTRDVYFNGVLSEQLKSYIQVKKKWGYSTDPDSHLFSHRDGRRLTTVALFHSFKEALKAAHLPVSSWQGEPGKKRAPWEGGKINPGFHPHSARHSYATILLGDTSDIRAVMKQLGHSNISMTRLYADCLFEHRQAVANKCSI